MSLTSIVVALVSVPFAFVAFFIMAKLDAGGFMKHNETLATVKYCAEHGLDSETLCYDPKYNPYKDPLRIILTVFLLVLVGASLWTAFQGVTANSIGRLPWIDVFLKTLVGLLIGLGIAKSGLGTECAVMAPHSLHMKAKHFDSMGESQRLPRPCLQGSCLLWD